MDSPSFSLASLQRADYLEARDPGTHCATEIGEEKYQQYPCGRITEPTLDAGNIKA